MRSAALVVALAGFHAAACLPVSQGRMNILDTKATPSRPATHFGLPLKTGQIFITEAPGAYSFVFVLIPEKFYRFTHASIVSIEDGQPYLYDISGEYRVGFNDRVMDNVDGEMRRTPFVDYAQANLYGEVYDPPPGTNGTLVAAFARQQFDAGVKFDAYFRLDEHQKLFCTELVQLALQAGGAKPATLVRVRDNPSLKTGMQWLGVPMDFALPAGVFAEESRYVGAVGQFPTRSAAYSYFAAKHELHRRFRRDQRMGYLFELKSSGDIEFRPEVDAFVIRASHAFENDPKPPPPGDPRIEAEVRRIADEMFGPVSDG